MFVKAICALSVLILSACSNVLPGALLLNQNEGGPGAIFEEPPVTFSPQEKPARPVSSAVLQQVLVNLKQAGALIPDDAAYFSSIIVGETARDVFYGDQSRALQKLTPEGRAFTKNLLRNCRLNPAKKTESGKAQPGSSVRINVALSSEGANCGYIVKKSVQKSRSISPMVADPKGNASRWSENVTTVLEDHRELRDESIQQLSQITGLHFVNKVTGTVAYKASNLGFEINATLKGAGQAEVSFANGMVLRGPVNSETVTEEGKVTVKVRFLGSTPQGDILILIIRDDVNVLKVYVNGEEAPSEILDAFGLNLMEVASRRY